MELRIAINELLLLRFRIRSALQGSQSMAAWYEAQSDLQPAASGGMCRIMLEKCARCPPLKFDFQCHATSFGTVRRRGLCLQRLNGLQCGTSGMRFQMPSLSLESMG